MGLALDELNGSEVPYKVNGLDVLIADKDKTYADKSTVDYVTAPDGEGFIINTEKSSDCQSGCGEAGCGG